MIKKPKGTSDIFKNIDIFLHIEETFKYLTFLFNYKEIKTPIFENQDLFKIAVGDKTDIISKEFYTFSDKANRKLALRPEATASIVRAYIENKLYEPNGSSKFSYLGPMFRYERPQKGRKRQFFQLGIEQIGSANEYATAESIVFANTLLTELKIKNYVLKINSIGNAKDRINYKKELKKYFGSKINSLCSNCQRRFDSNILRLLDCKEDVVSKDTPKIVDYLGDRALKFYNDVKKILDENNIDYQHDDSLVRGLDYYSNVIYEFEPLNSLGSQSAIIGGGQYLNLVKQLGGQDVGGVGFAAGIDRLINLIQEQNPYQSQNFIDAFIIASKEYKQVAFQVVNKLRKLDIVCDYDPLFLETKKQFKKLEKTQALYAVIIDQDYDGKNIKIKNQQNQDIQILTIKDVASVIKGEK